MAKYFSKQGLALALLAVLAYPLTAMAEVVEDEEGDAAVPSEVENLQGFPGDGEATLTWDAATDAVGVEGYYVYTGLESVEKNGGGYTFGSSDAGNSTTFTLENLTNGVTYYFAVTAYDEDGNESSYYSKEAEVTPESSELGDFTSPTVSSASAVTSTLVEVVFSEEVELPSDPTTAFALEATDGTAIQVLDAYIADEDASTVFLVTDEQTAGAQYILTVGIGVSDLDGNPVESGTSDTAIFTGSSLERSGDNDDDDDGDNTNEEFMVDSVEAMEVNEVLLTFTQGVVSAEPESFKVQMLDDASEEVEVLAVSIDEEDATQVTLITKDMESGYDYVLTMDDMIFNEAGESMGEENLTVEFTAKTLDLSDLIAPEDISDLLAEVSGEDSVLLSWTASVDSAGDLAKYLVYQSMDGGTSFEDALSADYDATEYEVDGLTAGETYTFKVSAVDENGNESEGVLTTVELPESGPELLLLGALSLLGAGAWSRRKKFF